MAPNKVTVGWCLDRARKSIGDRAEKMVVGLFQNPAIFYAAASVKDYETLATDARSIVMAEGLQGFIMEAWLRYLEEQHNFTLPSWMTFKKLGSMTIGGEHDPGLGEH